ncbi:uncharacterized protein B0H18DRAFT_1123296 [Fomitopsis serialis]|uniref:uncharacterized protein n=1 Tax=Fomitopsis serialis TaxID=139415 RepID=UPI002008DE88|nr:uncharacterized protein B0H18DRAFT_1123296 [Neoantrodia serialis]KAH9918026.1 hypothetical protein B0H18DRAFT_1123296 [Neoantrodia serialis]
MGRRAKYLTLADKHAAKRSQQAKYSATGRGKAQRAAQSRVQYASRHGHFPTPFPQKIEGISFAVLTHARKPFRILVSSTECSDLGLYTRPYNLVIPTQYSKDFSENDELFTDVDHVLNELTRILNSWQYWLLKESGRERYALFKTIGGKGLAERLQEEVDIRLQSWVDAVPKEILTQTAVVRVVGTEWAARIVCCLALELQLLESSTVEYERSFYNESLPWQMLYHSPVC